MLDRTFLSRSRNTKQKPYILLVKPWWMIAGTKEVNQLLPQADSKATVASPCQPSAAGNKTVDGTKLPQHTNEQRACVGERVPVESRRSTPLYELLRNCVSPPRYQMLRLYGASIRNQILFQFVAAASSDVKQENQ